MFWFHPDLERLENKIQELEYHPNLVFFGSSTFTLWDEIDTIFKEYKPLNLGFGGSTLAACTWYFERVFKNINNIESIIIYAGDNDLGDGRHPEEVVLFMENLLLKIREKYKNIKVTCISIKPSIARKNLQESIHYTNACMKALMFKDENFFYVNIFKALLDENGNPDTKYFIEDGLHFNSEGYSILLNALKSRPEIFPVKILQEV